jgi:putative ATPase
MSSQTVPLAEQLRPQKLDEIVGQIHLLGENKPIDLWVKSQKVHSAILWGPPGVGKTTLARILAQAFDCQWLALSAVLAGVKDIRQAIDQAKQSLELGIQTILFVDEIHRFNKSQQDALLPDIESGVIHLIGATTENPSFELNNALLSRAQVYVLSALTDDDLRQLFIKAQTHCAVFFDESASNLLIQWADGDARRLLNLVETSAHSARILGFQNLDAANLELCLQKQPKRFDKQGDHFYDQISALHKSVRGSDPDAALYWFCVMIENGADPLYLARRLVRMAWEDIGLADPRAIDLALQAAQTFERLGSPEGELALAEAVIYLAVAPKSNAAYRAYKQARAFVKQDKSREVPIHLRNAPTALMKNLGHGQGYRYAHDEPDGVALGENYLPEGMQKPHWYEPVNRGLEIKLKEKLDRLNVMK